MTKFVRYITFNLFAIIALTMPSICAAELNKSISPNADTNSQSKIQAALSLYYQQNLHERKLRNLTSTALLLRSLIFSYTPFLMWFMNAQCPNAFGCIFCFLQDTFGAQLGCGPQNVFVPGKMKIPAIHQIILMVMPNMFTDLEDLGRTI